MAVEQLFPHFKSQDAPTTAFYDPSDPETYDRYLHMLIDDSVDYEQAFLGVDRSNAQLYYYGYEPRIGPYNPQGPYVGEDPTATLGEILDGTAREQNVPNKSTFVSTDVRDAILLMLPGLIRLFGASESPVTLVPRNEAEVNSAEQATDYVNYTFWNENNGFLILYGAIKDALTVRTGFVKWWSDNDREVQRKTFVNISHEQVQLLLSEDPTAKVVLLGKPIPQIFPLAPPAPVSPAPAPAPAPPMGMAGPGAPGGMGAQFPGPLSPFPFPPPPPPTIYSRVVISYEKSKPAIKVAGVPPEEMRLDRYARTFKESRIVGHERIVPVDQLIAMGYDRETCLDHVQSSESSFTTEPQLRNASRFMGTRMGDGVKYGEWYVKIDKDGDGVPELRYLCTMGDTHEIVADEEANRVKFALFSVDPISHTIVGDSIEDLTEDIQRIKTNAMRAILDSAAESINPKTVYNELMVNTDDVMNDDLGALIRTRGDPSTAVMFTQTPFLGQQMMPVIDMLNDVAARRTGLTDAAKGLDPKALQSSTTIGVESIINGAQERVELVARVLAETGFKDLFSGLYNEICENPNQRKTLKIRGKWVPYDTSTFDASMSVEVNPNLGKGSDMVRLVALNQIDQKQQLIVSQYGLGNPVCGIIEMLNTQSDMLELANIKNVGRYFRTPTPEELANITAQPKTPDPSAVLAQSQLEKVRSDTAAELGKQRLAAQKHLSDDAFRHQQLAAKTQVDGAKLALEARKLHVEQGSQIGQIAKDQADAASQDQQMQMDAAQNQQQMDLTHQKAQSDIHLAEMKAASAHAVAMVKARSQHVLGALAAQNQKPEAE